MRKQVLVNDQSAKVSSESGELDIPAIATALVSSEAAEYPIENAFDSRHGPGGSRWVAAEPGEQTLILAFDNPQPLSQISLEIEELDASRTQELQLAVSQDGHTYQEILRQEYNFSPPGTSFEREDWSVTTQPVTHLRLWIKPDKSGRPHYATLTSLRLR